MANLTITKVTHGYFDFNDDANNTYGGNNISYWYDATNIYFKVNNLTYTYTYKEVSYDDGTETIGFASTIEVIAALKTAGFTGNFNSPQGGGGTWGSITGTLSDQTDLDNALDLKADLSSPTFTGTPLAPTATSGTNTTQIATTAFVKQAVDNASSTLKTMLADTTTTLATAQAITSLTQALEINSTYIVRGNLRNGCSGTGGVKFAITYPTSTIAVVQAVGMLGGVNTASWNAHSNAISGVLQNAVSTFVGVTGTYNLQGTIKTGGTAGNLVFSFASTTAGQTSTIYTDGTYIEIIKIA